MFQLSANSILDLLQRMVAACEFHNYKGALIFLMLLLLGMNTFRYSFVHTPTLVSPPADNSCQGCFCWTQGQGYEIGLMVVVVSTQNTKELYMHHICYQPTAGSSLTSK
jgi:hypothetical protein